MKTLLEDYKRRLVTVKETIKTTSDSGSRNDIAKMARLNTKAGEYRAFIVEIERAIDREADSHLEKLSEPEVKTRLAKLRNLSFSDLKALETECETKMNYYQRRFPKDRKANKNIYQEMYTLWIWWYSLSVALTLAIKEYVENLHT